MKTDDLIGLLAANTQPVPRSTLLRRLLVASAIGGFITLALVGVLYGFRPDLSTAVLTEPFWMKAAFTGTVAVIGFAAVERASRPGARVMPRLLFLAGPFVAIIALAIIELLHSPAAERVPLWLGQTWRSCAFSIIGLSLPPLLLLLLAMRHLAPTRPGLAGMSAGFLAAGLAATAYGLHCPERTASFIATWYALGLLGAGCLGAIVGRRLLHW
jgi:hypothetical protein